MTENGSAQVSTLSLVPGHVSLLHDVNGPFTKLVVQPLEKGEYDETVEREATENMETNKESAPRG